MATIGKLRERSGAVIFIIGAAMVLFIVSDSLNSNQALFNGGPETSVGEIDGKEVDAKYFDAINERFLNNAKQQRNTAELSAVERIQVNNQTWETIVESQLLEAEFEHLGMRISEDEMNDMAYGPEPHSYLTQIPAFMDDNQKYDPNKLREFINNFDNVPAESQTNWADLIDEVKSDRLRNKYFAMISKGIYMTDLEAQDDYIGNNKQYNIKYARLKSADLPDENYEVSEAEMQAYAKENDLRYKEDERGFQYVSFAVEPSAADTANTRNQIADLAAEFATTTNEAAFARLHSDGALAEDKFYSIADLSEANLLDAALMDQVFEVPVGHVFEPTFELGTFRLVKIVAEEPQTTVEGEDGKSAENFKTCFRASHILIKPEGDNDTAKAMEEAKKLMDRVKKGEKFAELALEFGTDGTKDKGGDLGWWEDGKMVKAFQNGVNTMKNGELKVVKSRFGAHLIQLTAEPLRVRRKIAIIEKTVTPSEQTESDVYAKAAEFFDRARTAQAFVDATLEMDLNVGLAENVKAMDATITGFTDGRELVKWAFRQEEVDMVSDIINIDNSYVIAMLTEIKVKDDLEILGKETEIKTAIVKEKKLDELEAKMKASYTNDINALAEALQVEVESATAVNFATPVIANLGNEPAVIGAVAALGDGILSQVIRGNEGVYVVLVEGGSEVTMPPSFADYKVKQIKSKATGARFEISPALKKTVTLIDTRYNFY
ncbi:MAG: SurA N-terminal domain-containing protein [Bacteroidetes bacterium]|nr:SurA N-terminal domain-containing protein [Bacteroidota bacterium]